MIAICAVIWVHVCIPQSYLHTASLFDMTIHPETRLASEVQRLGVKIDVYGTDSFSDFGTAGENRACKEGRCVYYRKRCDADGKICEYSGGFNAEGEPRATAEWSMKIEASTAAGLHRAEKVLYLDLNNYGSKSNLLLPLSALTVQSTSTNLFYCKAGVRIQGCLTPEEAHRLRFGHD